MLFHIDQSLLERKELHFLARILHFFDQELHFDQENYLFYQDSGILGSRNEGFLVKGMVSVLARLLSHSSVSSARV